MKMREIAEREHKVKHHPLESPSHQKVKPLKIGSFIRNLHVLSRCVKQSVVSKQQQHP